ncbi:MAG: carboxypeptidase regulatory-like domain-containing protein [Deltaproteobacteria bacterium]|nr:carboxypeptidase regulatory-like domain-containing protein [Deltaproteobacteria bacterium]
MNVLSDHRNTIYGHFFTLRTAAILVSLACTGLIVAACGDSGGGHGGNNQNNDGGLSGTERIYGKVLDTSTDQPMEGVTITASIDGEGLTDTVTNDHGRFMIIAPKTGTYAVTARLDGYTYAQRKVVIATGSIEAVRPMYLTPIDPKAVVIGSEGGQGENSDGSITIDVPAGALKGSTEMHFTPFSHGWTLPNDLPSLSHFTYACELSPEGQTFKHPVTLKIRNTRGFAPGTPIPVGIYDSHSLVWTHESMGTVSDDGQWVVFQVEHFSARDCNLGRTSPDGGGSPDALSDESSRRRTHRNNHPCSAIHAGSLVGVTDGHLTISHDLPKHQVLSQKTGLSLVYNSGLVQTHALLWLTYDITSTSTLPPDRIRFIAEVGGNRVERTYTPQNRAMSFGYLWNGKDPMGNDLPEGTYHYRMTLANQYRTTFAEVDEFGGEAVDDTGIEADELLPFASTKEGDLVLGRSTDKADWPLGVGWGLAALYRLSRNDDGTVWIRSGEGSAFGYMKNDQGSYEPHAGDFSSLVEESDGTFTWTRLDGAHVKFDENGLAVSTTDADGNATGYKYDAAGRLTGVIDPTGKTTTLAYDGQGRLSSIADPMGRTTTITQDDEGNLIGITNPDGSARTFTYDDKHQLTAQTDAGGHVTQYQYDSIGAIARVDRPDGSHTEHVSLLSMSTDEIQNDTLSYRDGNGGTYLFLVNQFGTRTRIQDPLGRVVTMERTPNDLLLAAIHTMEDDSHSITGFKYDDRGNTIMITGPLSISDADEKNLFMDYDDQDRMVSIRHDIVGAYSMEYQGSHRAPTTVTLPDNRVVRFTYDDQGLRTSMDVAGRTVTYEHDASGNISRVTVPGGATWTYDYDEYGNLTTLTDPDGRQESTTSNQMNEPTHKATGDLSFDFEYTPGSGTSASARYPDDLTAVADSSGARTQFGYDERHRLTSITDPLGNETTLSYDGQGHLTQRALANGETESFSYNEAGQLTGRTMSSGQQYDYTYGDRSGLLLTTSSPVGNTTWSYDNAMRASSIALDFADHFLASLDYDYRSVNSTDFTATLSTSSDSWSFSFGYDSENSLDPYYIFGGTAYMGITLSYDASGLVSGWDSWGDWLHAHFNDDAMGRVIGAQYVDSSDQVAVDLSFVFSLAGLVTSVTSLEGQHVFTYDTAGRITAMTHPSADNPDEAFTYDSAGNRRRSGQETEYRYDAAHRLLQDADYTYSYDEAGNRLSRISRSDGSTTQYGYDGRGQLTHVTLPSDTRVEYRYDAFARRVEKWVDDALVTRFIWHGDELFAEFDGAGTIVRLYTPTPTVDRPVGVSVRDNNADLVDYYYAPGPDGTILVLLDENGVIVESYRYRAFGAPVGLPASPKNTRLFAGMDYDTTTGLYNVRARWYDPQSGQFLQPDPLPMGRALSPYDFADNHPWSATDPSGYETDHNSMDGFSTLVTDQAVKPTLEKAIVTGVSKIPVVGGVGSKVVSTGLMAKDLIKIAISDDPLKAGRDWYKSQWWNPAAKYVDSFTSLGGVGSTDSKDKGKGGSPRPGCMWTPIFGR